MLNNLSQYYKNRRQPDILDCIANLSNDEVFTPPVVADKILDLLGKPIPSDIKEILKWLEDEKNACRDPSYLLLSPTKSRA